VGYLKGLREAVYRQR